MLRRKDKQAPPRPSEFRGHFLGNYLLSCEHFALYARNFRAYKCVCAVVFGDGYFFMIESRKAIRFRLFPATEI